MTARGLDRPAEQLVDLGEAGERHDMHQDGVAVGLGGGRELRADLAGGAGLGLDHHRLLDQRLQHRGEWARDDVNRAAGRERIDEGDRARWISVLAERRSRGERRGSCGGADNEVASVHTDPPWQRRSTRRRFC